MIKITADSVCDLTPAILEELDITLVPLYIHAGDQVFRDGVDITPEEVFRFAETHGKLCRTGALNSEEYKDFFAPLASRYESVIHINIGQHFSICHQNACVAAREFTNVYVLDSQNLSSGSGHLVYDAALMARDGVGAQEICRRIQEEAPLVDASFVIDRLDYLYKGGRCSGLEAIGARLLSIKPCIEVADGKMRVGKKYRGSFELCLERYVEDRLRLREGDSIDKSRLFITHPACSPETVARVREVVAKLATFEEIIETRAGCTISSHCGPKTLGVLFKRLP
ncbi:MAG: DegV family protein [Oscillospiraceae bacterium]|nr:DegV family protein [Oscillospiraceae bacterium]